MNATTFSISQNGKIKDTFERIFSVIQRMAYSQSCFNLNLQYILTYHTLDYDAYITFIRRLIQATRSDYPMQWSDFPQKKKTLLIILKAIQKNKIRIKPYQLESLEKLCTYALYLDSLLNRSTADPKTIAQRLDEAEDLIQSVYPYVNTPAKIRI